MKQTTDEVQKETQDIRDYTTLEDLLLKHGGELSGFISSLNKKKAWKKKWKSYFPDEELDSRKPLVLIKKNGNVVFRNIYDLHWVAGECFERGIAFLADQCQQATNASEIMTALNEKDDKKVKQFFIDRIEKTENLLRNRPQTDYFSQFCGLWLYKFNIFHKGNRNT
jgi:sulfur carrier protein ThiS